jgi:epoxyqueuosine reductase
VEFIKNLQHKIRDWGASIYGYSWVGDKIPERLRKLEFAVTIGVRLSDFIIDEITDRPTYTYFHHYRTVNTLIDQIALKTMLTIEENGYYAVAVPASQTVHDVEEKYSAIFPHKTAAVRAGLGWIGRNGLFVSKDYGPRIRLGTILTDMKLPVIKSTVVAGCGECRRCVESCPAMALTGNCWHEGCKREHVVDARACSEYMNAKFKHIGRGSVCGVCIKVCPHGEKRKREDNL